MKATLDIRTKAVLLCTERVKPAKEICGMYDISERTLRRWKGLYKTEGVEGLKPEKPGPKKAGHGIPKDLEQRILRLKQKHISWGARRIKYQYDLPVHWRTVHDTIKKNGLLIRVKAKPQPGKRFQRRHVDSMWRGIHSSSG